MFRIFRSMWRTECLNTRFPLQTVLVYTGYNVKIFFKLIYFITLHKTIDNYSIQLDGLFFFALYLSFSSIDKENLVLKHSIVFSSPEESRQKSVLTLICESGTHNHHVIPLLLNIKIYNLT